MAETLKNLRIDVAENPVTKKDIEGLKKFRVELDHLSEKIKGISTRELTKEIDRIVLTEPDRITFQSISTLKEKIDFLLDRFKNVFVGMIKRKVASQMYFVWAQKQRFNQSLEDIVDLNKDIGDLEAKLAKSPKNKKLVSRLEGKKAILAKRESFVREYEKNLAVGAATRKDLVAIGGTRVDIETKDHEHLDGIYLSAEKFCDNCKKAGAKQAKLNIFTEGNAASSIQGLALGRDSENAKAFIETLNRLRVFKDSSNKDSGWAKIVGEDRIYIVPNFELQKLIESDVVQKNEAGEYSFVAAANVEAEESDIQFNPQNSGTMILGMGAAGVYEMYKREALALLMQGMNVMLYNQRGHGESWELPLKREPIEIYNAVYDYLKKVHKINDDKLVVRGLCLSGGVAAYLASKHPKINLILNQTYAEVVDISVNTVLDSIKDILNYKPSETNLVKKLILKALTPIVRSLVVLLSPGYSVIRHLKKIEGKLLILRSLEDTYVTKNMTDKIIEAIASNITYDKMRNQVRIGHMPGIHGASWLDAKTEGEGEKHAHLGRHHIFSFLNELGVVNSFIDKKSVINNLAADYNQYLENGTKTKTLIHDVVERLPENPNDVQPLFNQIPLGDIEKEIKEADKEVQIPVVDPTTVVDGKNRFAEVLKVLDGLKDQLGGSPNFVNGPPVIDLDDNKKTFMGIPKAGVKDWFRMVVDKKWKPAPFWKRAARLFDVERKTSNPNMRKLISASNAMECSWRTRIDYIQILDDQRADRYNELNSITGMAWHPAMNGAAIEKLYIDFIETFLTTHFEEAKKRGGDALLEYLKLLAVCALKTGLGISKSM